MLYRTTWTLKRLQVTLKFYLIFTLKVIILCLHHFLVCLLEQWFRRIPRDTRLLLRNNILKYDDDSDDDDDDDDDIEIKSCTSLVLVNL